MPKRQGWRWPQDRNAKEQNRGFRGGLKDILLGRGPDMYIGDFRGPPLDFAEWARYPELGAYPPRYDDSRDTPSWAQRGLKSYDPKSRKYVYRPPPMQWHAPWLMPWHAMDSPMLASQYQATGNGSSTSGDDALWGQYGQTAHGGHRLHHGRHPGHARGPEYDRNRPGLLGRMREPVVRLVRRPRTSIPKDIDELQRAWIPVLDYQNSRRHSASRYHRLGGYSPNHIIGGHANASPNLPPPRYPWYPSRHDGERPWRRPWPSRSSTTDLSSTSDGHHRHRWSSSSSSDGSSAYPLRGRMHSPSLWPR